MDPPQASAPRGVVVLLVDDQPIIGEAVRRMLAGEEGIAFHYCKDAPAALEMAAEVGPTVILQDLVMPEIDGLELVRRFRADERFRDVPIIVLSTKEEPAVKAEAFAVGANDYIVKLPDRLELMARVRYHSRGYVALARTERGVRGAAGEPAGARQRPGDGGPLRAVAPAAAAAAGQRGRPTGGSSRRRSSVATPSATTTSTTTHFAVYLLDVCGHGVGAALL